ncbi:MAG: ATP-binding cassette domain-containing protein [Phycisphaerales bacterium JB064]
MTTRSAHARALFALPQGKADPARRAALRSARDAAKALASLQPGQIALLTGPSGSGKSTALAMLRRRLARQKRAVVRPPAHLSRRRATIDQVGENLHDALHILSAAGLAEAALFPRPAGALSTGQLARLTIAAAMDRCTPGCVLIADEFAAVLDRVTARSLASALARWCRATNVTLIVAAAHDDTLEALRPDLLVALPLPGERPSPPIILARAPRGANPWPTHCPADSPT